MVWAASDFLSWHLLARRVLATGVLSCQYGSFGVTDSTDKRLLWERILALRSDLYNVAVHNSSLTSEQVLMMSAELDQLILAYMAPGPQAQGAST